MLWNVDTISLLSHWMPHINKTNDRLCIYIHIYILSKFVPSGQTSQCVSVDVWYGSLAKIGMVSGWVINSTVSTCRDLWDLPCCFAVSIVWITLNRNVYVAGRPQNASKRNRVARWQRLGFFPATPGVGPGNAGVGFYRWFDDPMILDDMPIVILLQSHDAWETTVDNPTMYFYPWLWTALVRFHFITVLDSWSIPLLLCLIMQDCCL